MILKLIRLCLVFVVLLSCKKESPCVKTVNFQVEASYTGAKVIWQPFDEAIRIFFRETGNKTWTELSTLNNTFLIDELKINTSYQLAVRYKCSDSKYAAFTKPFEFRTRQSPGSIDLGKEFYNKQKQHFISFTSDEKYFYVLSYNDDDWDCILYKYDPEKAHAIDSFLCPHNLKNICYDGKDLILAWDTAGTFSTKFAKISKVNGNTISSYKCPIDFKNEKKVFDAMTFDGEFLYVIKTDYSSSQGKTSLSRINCQTNTVIDTRDFDWHVGWTFPNSFTFKEGFLYLIQYSTLKKFTPIGSSTWIYETSERQMSATSVTKNFTILLTTAYGDLYVVCIDWNQSCKIGRLTY